MNVIHLLLILCSMVPSLRAVVVGSNTTVSQQTLTTFPMLDTDNEIRGFAFFNSGFNFENSLTSCIFNSLFPVGGSSTLNGGTLNLSKDIIFNNTSALVNVGVINGNGYSMRFTTTAKMTLPSGASSSGGLAAAFNLITSSNISFGINSLDWSYDGTYVAVGRVSGTGNDFQVFSFNGTTLANIGGVDLTIAGDSVRYHPTKYWVAVGAARVASTSVYELRIYDTTGGTLTSKSNLDLNQNARAVAWSPDGTKLAVTMDYTGGTTDAITVYSIDQSTAAITAAGTTSLGSSAVYSNNALDWNPTGTAFVLGLAANASLNALRLYGYQSSTLTLKASISYGSSVGVTAVSWHPTLPYIAVGLSGSSQNIRVYSYDGLSTLTDLTALYVGEATAAVNAVHWSPDGTKLLIGRSSNATGTELRIYGLDTYQMTLTLLQQLDFSGNINAVRWSKSGTYIASGGALNNVEIYQGIITQTLSSFLTFKNTSVTFNTNITAGRSLLFNGLCKLDAQGHNLDLLGTYSIVVGYGASLLLQNVNLRNVASSLQCLDSLGTVSLLNVHIQQSMNSTYTLGQLDIVGDVYMDGGYQFSYQSPQLNTIASYGRWFFGPGTTFQYAPSSATNKALVMTDGTSRLAFIDATFNIGSGGLQMKKGMLTAEGWCPIISSGADQAHGLIVGDGASSANDVAVKVLGESRFDVQSGYFVVNNVVP